MRISVTRSFARGILAMPIAARPWLARLRSAKKSLWNGSADRRWRTPEGTMHAYLRAAGLAVLAGSAGRKKAFARQTSLATLIVDPLFSSRFAPRGAERVSRVKNRRAESTIATLACEQRSRHRVLCGQDDLVAVTSFRGRSGGAGRHGGGWRSDNGGKKPSRMRPADRNRVGGISVGAQKAQAAKDTIY